MKKPKKMPPQALAKSIELAKQLVEGHTDSSVSPGDRLREIGTKLNVSRIEVGAVRTAGFLKRLPDRSFAVFYANDCNVVRRRFTVAHELAHLVLERFHKHVGREDADMRRNSYHFEIEKAVDRIAAELLMPERLVIGMLKTQCQLERERSAIGVIQKRMVLQQVGKCLGVSELALVHRLLELPELMSVLIRFQWNEREGPERPRYFPVSYSPHCSLRFVGEPFPDSRNLRKEDGWEHQVLVQTLWGPRQIHCHAWRRPANSAERGAVQTWILGWAWKALPLPPWDDSEYKVAIPDVNQSSDTIVESVDQSCYSAESK